MSCRDRENLQKLTAWFVDRLDRCEVQFGDEPMSYESNTDYDIQFYRLQKEAADYWASHHGEVPTPGTLMQAFFNAEYERSARARSATAGFGAALRGKLKSLRSAVSALTGFSRKNRSVKRIKREF